MAACAHVQWLTRPAARGRCRGGSIAYSDCSDHIYQYAKFCACFQKCTNIAYLGAKPLDYKSFSNISSADAKELCDNLNTFYARFDSKDNYSTLIDELETVCDNDNPIDISEHEVRLLFKELYSRKSPGPDNISPLLLKSCHNELSGVYQHLFQLSISSGIPRIIMENCCNCTCAKENHCKRVQ